jgi:hypothetical protein
MIENYQVSEFRDDVWSPLWEGPATSPDRAVNKVEDIASEGPQRVRLTRTPDGDVFFLETSRRWFRVARVGSLV